MNPLMIAALLMGGSMLSNVQAQKKRDSARKGAFRRAETDRDTQKATSLRAYTDSIDKGSKLRESEDAKKAELQQQYLANEQGPKAPLPTAVATPQSAAPELVADASRRSGRTDQYLDSMAGNRATMNAWGNMMPNFADVLRGNATDIDVANRNTQNYSNYILPMDLNAAQTQGHSWQSMADLMQLGAQVAMMKGLQAPQGQAPLSEAGISRVTHGAQIGVDNPGTLIPRSVDPWTLKPTIRPA